MHSRGVWSVATARHLCRARRNIRMGPWKRPRGLGCVAVHAGSRLQPRSGHGGVVPVGMRARAQALQLRPIRRDDHGRPDAGLPIKRNGVRYGSGATQRPHQAHSGWVQAEQVLVQRCRRGGLADSCWTYYQYEPDSEGRQGMLEIAAESCYSGLVNEYRPYVMEVVTDNVFQLQASGDRTVRPTLWRVGSPDEIALQACRQAWQETSRRGSTRSPVRTH